MYSPPSLRSVLCLFFRSPLFIYSSHNPRSVTRCILPSGSRSHAFLVHWKPTSPGMIPPARCQASRSSQEYPPQVDTFTITFSSRIFSMVITTQCMEKWVCIHLCPSGRSTSSRSYLGLLPISIATGQSRSRLSRINPVSSSMEQRLLIRLSSMQIPLDRANCFTPRANQYGGQTPNPQPKDFHGGLFLCTNGTFHGFTQS